MNVRELCENFGFGEESIGGLLQLEIFASFLANPALVESKESLNEDLYKELWGKAAEAVSAIQ